MNVKPGLAFIVSPYKLQKEIGRVVTVIRMGAPNEVVRMRNGGEAECVGVGGPGWLCDANDGEYPCFIGAAYLRPIQNPGEDATDEMVALLGKPASQPSKEHA